MYTYTCDYIAGTIHMYIIGNQEGLGVLEKHVDNMIKFFHLCIVPVWMIHGTRVPAPRRHHFFGVHPLGNLQGALMPADPHV